jgi:hypothetical protein
MEHQRLNHGQTSVLSVKHDLASSLMHCGGHLPIASMLYHMQDQRRIGDGDWSGFEAAMNRLAQLIEPNDLRMIPSVAGENL